MGKILKWIGIVLGGLVGAIVVVVAVVFLIANGRVNKTYDIAVAAVVNPPGEAAVERGQHLAESIGSCTECHGDGLSGDLVVDDPMFGTVVATNLTSGRGGIGGSYTDIDYVRAIRHGVRPDGKAMVIMPSQYFNEFSDDDLGAIISYLKTLPPVDNDLPETSLGPLGRVLPLLDKSLLPALIIDHEAPRPADPVPGVTAKYGKYLGVVCTACHGKDLAGGPLAGEGPDAPLATNLTPAGALASWTEADFFAALREGVTPDGRSLDSEYMPWLSLRKMHDDEIKAVWLYVKSVPAKESAE